MIWTGSNAMSANECLTFPEILLNFFCYERDRHREENSRIERGNRLEWPDQIP